MQRIHRLAGLCLTLALLAGCDGGTTEGHPAVNDGMDTPEHSTAPPPGERTAQAAFQLLSDTDAMRLSMTIRTPCGSSVISVHVDRVGNCTGTFDMGPMQRGELIKGGQRHRQSRAAQQRSVCHDATTVLSRSSAVPLIPRVSAHPPAPRRGLPRAKSPSSCSSLARSPVPDTPGYEPRQ